MDSTYPIIDETWCHRPPHAKLRISAGGVVLRRQEERVYMALAREADLPLYVLPPAIIIISYGGFLSMSSRHCSGRSNNS